MPIVHRYLQSPGTPLESPQQQPQVRHSPGIVTVLRASNTITRDQVVIAAEGGSLHPGWLHYGNVAPGKGLT